MECPTKAFDGTVDLLFDPVSHFARCLVSEGNGENLCRHGLMEEMSERVVRTRLSGAGNQDEQRQAL